ncbi:GNAT family N-acetyltransferase [bacterium]|nr:GNAT family N-acetyltransferase [bacterium]
MKNKEWKILQVKSKKESEELNNLLWQVLWKPLSLPQDMISKFKLTGESKKFIAKQDDKLIGGLVAFSITPIEMEIRHIAVLPKFQEKGVGSKLVDSLITFASEKRYTRIYTIARNTSVEFFKKLGFTDNPQQKPPDHPAFTKHGITFYLLELSLLAFIISVKM